ncbi:MAG: methyltransferase domain-containing protein [Clostridia bacterium]|nr:methyltransferase domain-containing protein [Clostridia bacterium]
MIQLPEAFCARMKKLLGEEYPAFLASYDAPPQRGLRVNRCKSTPDAVKKTGLPLRPCSFSEDGFYLDCTEVGTGNLPVHHAGMFYLQEPAAMIPVASAAITPGSYVLDVCAAPGGKSTQLASLIGENGLLVSNEFVPSRAKILLSNIERLGVPNAVVTNTDAAHLKSWYEGCFDVVLVDAPCSGEGMFRKNPQAVTEWSEENVAMCAERSHGILADAAACLRPGGTLIYSTCTFAPEKNEYLIARFLSENEDFTVIPVPDAVRSMTTPGLPVPDCRCNLTLSARCYPHVTGGEGQYVCVLKKSGDAPRRPIKDLLTTPTKQELSVLTPVLKDLFGEIPFEVKKYKDMLCAVTANTAVNGVCFSCGVRLGEIKGGRLVPHHQLFSAFGNRMKLQWHLKSDDPRVLRYLHGDTIELTADEGTADGFGCVLVDGCALGGGKNVGGTIKNHYPKGLRIQGI